MFRIVAAAAWLSFIAASASAQQTLSQRTLSQRIASLHGGALDIGAQSCAAASCHGGPRPGQVDREAERGSEYQIWFEQDPHARGAWTLSNPLSLHMFAQLGIMRDGKVVDAEAYRNCLMCHNPSRVRHQRATSRTFVNNGVSCESCHGPADAWLATHYRRDWDKSQSLASGKVDSKHLLTRARLCADCHVGSRNREVNHDMIAAGHPVLRFEFASYHNRLPKHWRHSDENASDGEFQAQLWLAGQLATAEASLSLLEARTDVSRKTSVWPELSEFNCGGCHFPLRPGSGRRVVGANRLPTWGDWPFSALRRHFSEAQPDLDQALSRVERKMESFENRESIRSEVKQLRAGLDRWIATAGDQNLQRAPALLDQFTGSSPAASRSQDWERWAQFYLGAINRYRDRDHSTALRQLRSQLVDETAQRNRWRLEPTAVDAAQRLLPQLRNGPANR